MAYRQNIISNMTTRLVMLFLAFIGSILIARALGPEQKGALAFAWNVFILFATYGHLGINNVVIYFHKSRGISYPILVKTNAIFLFILSLRYGGSFFLLKTTGVVFTRYGGGFLVLGTVFIFSSYLSVLIKAYYIANENLIQMNRYALVAESTGVLIIIGLFFKGRLTPFSCIAISVFSLLFQAMLLGRGERLIFSGFKLRLDKELLKQELGYGSHAFLFGLFLFLIYRADQFFIHFYLGDESLGVYSVAVGIASCFLFVPESIKTALTGKLYSFKNDSDEKFRYFHQTVSFSVIICTAMAIAGMILSPWIYILYGREFAGGVKALRILLSGIVFLSFSQLGAIFFFTMGEIKKCAAIAAVACCLNMLLNTLLIPAYGIEGAAAGSLISYIALAAMTAGYLLNNKKIRLRDLLIPKKEEIMALNRIKRLL